jgi:hypothetical protein
LIPSSIPVTKSGANHDYAEGIDVEAVFGALPHPLKGFRSGLLSAPEYQKLIRKLGARNAEATLLTMWAQGIAIGIAEQALFGTDAV